MDERKVASADNIGGEVQQVAQDRGGEVAQILDERSELAEKSNDVDESPSNP